MDSIFKMEEAIAYLLKKDAIFEKINQRFGIPIQPKRPQGFQTLVLLILEQQVSIASAKATFNKLKIAIPDFSVENVFIFSDIHKNKYFFCGRIFVFH